MSDFTQTPNLNLYKPTYNADAEQWGAHLNANADTLDAVISSIPGGSTGGFLPTAGGAMTGPLNYATTGAGGLQRSAQDRAAVVANALDFGADPTGLADSTAAIAAAIATGYNVYIPRGNYIVRNQLTTQATGQEIYGDGRLTTLLIDQTFNASATCVISLVGREQWSPTIRDLNIKFAQPSDQNSRANFKTLAAGGTSGTGGTGIMYPPAIGITNSNRFKLRNLRVSLAWDGIINMGTNTIGGFFIRDVEMSAFDVGLSIDNVFDFGHISGYHYWAFDMSSSLLTVQHDGNTFAAKFGVNNDYGVCSCYDFCCYDSRLQIAGANSAMDFYGLHMDGNNATLEISNGNQIQICGVYFSGTPTGANPSTAQCNVSGGKVIISNIYAQVGSGFPAIAQSGGFLVLDGGQIQGGANNETLIQQSGGRSYISGILFSNPASVAWTVPIINVSAGLTMFHGNTIQLTSVGDVGALVIATDNAQHSVVGNSWNGWSFTAPGPLGDYGFNASNAVWGKQLILGKTGQGGRVDFRRGTDGAASAWVGHGNASGSFNVFDVTNTGGSGLVRLNAGSGGADVFLIGTVEYGRVDANGLGIAKITAAPSAPGAAQARLAFVAGTNAGTGKLVAYCGTSATPVTIMDNIGAGF